MPLTIKESAGDLANNVIQNYWNNGLGYFTSGQPSTVAIQNLWDDMAPPASLPLLATIIGALYGDTYWNTTQMNSVQLSSDLQASLGLDAADCNQAATIAFQQWQGLFVRANMGDPGNIPHPDPVTESPDVVINGVVALGLNTLIRQWNSHTFALQPNLKNYVYGRAQSINIDVPITKPVIRMYYTDAGFNPSPASWVQLFTYDQAKATSTPLFDINNNSALAPGERAANSTAMAFTPPGAGHYCVLTLAGSEYFTNNPASSPGNWNSQQWIHYNGAAGWHNVDVATKEETALNFTNQDGTTERFIFEAHCRNLPLGTQVTLECNDKNLIHPISTNPLTITKGDHVLSTEADIPPNFSGKLLVRFKTPDGTLLPQKASINVRMNWRIPPNHAHYHQALAQVKDLKAVLQGEHVRIGMGNFTLIG